LKKPEAKATPSAAVEHPERRAAERSEAARSGGGSTAERQADPRLEVPDPQVPEKARRRRFTAEFKLQVLREADRCTEPGAIGALLRRHGLYSSLLTTWRRERDEGALRQLGRKRGRKPSRNPLQERVTQLERENRKLQNRLRQAETIIDVQKKVAEILGIPLNTPPSEGDD
jgi:transposase-like protein